MNFLIDRGEGALITDEALTGERFRLALERIRQMESEEETDPVFVPYFQAAAKWVLVLLEHRRMLENGSFETMPPGELAAANRALYEDILPENYDRSWANPVHDAKVFGKEYGQLMAALFFELRCMISIVYEGDAERFLTRMELLLEVYCAFTAAFEEYRREIASSAPEDTTGKSECDSAYCAPSKAAGQNSQNKDSVIGTSLKNESVNTASASEDTTGKSECDSAASASEEAGGKFIGNPDQAIGEADSNIRETACMAAVSAVKDVSPIPPSESIREKIRQFLEDYALDETFVRVRRNLVGGNIAEKIIEDYKPGDSRCLYRTGAYVSENERGTYEYIEQLSDEDISRMADTWTEGFRIGFEVTGKDLSIRRRAGILFPVGFERVVNRAVKNLEAMGLESIIPGMQADLFTQHLGRGGGSISTTPPNPQYSYDHREDLALFFNDVLRGRRVQALQEAYKELADETAGYAGPVVMDTFGERPFSPEMREECPKFTKSQQRKITRFNQQANQFYDKAIIGKERSFTIIAFPVPEITKGYPDGDLAASYDEIFRAVIDINTLDYMTYRDVQAGIISILDTARSIHVLGKNGNRTDLTVRLQTPRDPEKQTIFENCVADVNIPVGEVFTTPELQGTDGLLHVNRVYLNGLLFEDLAIRFKDGRIADYSCGGFPTEEEGRRYIEENILFHHETLPMGECAIGTNTTACAEAARLGILERLPILIAEKTGPHFAVGDTCYSHEEENYICNPDGKEIFAKDNDYSRLRDTDPDKAYFGCHTDITIPYDEVGLLEAVRADGTLIPVIRDGLFVPEAAEILNEPLKRRL